MNVSLSVKTFLITRIVFRSLPVKRPFLKVNSNITNLHFLELSDHINIEYLFGVIFFLGSQFLDWFGAISYSGILSIFLFNSSYVLQPMSFMICFKYCSLALPLHFIFFTCTFYHNIQNIPILNYPF